MFDITHAKKCLVASSLLLLLSSCTMVSGRETAGQYVDDTTITTRVKKAFVEDPIVHPTQVHVETMQGVVQLSGFVDSARGEARAVELARQVDGVKSVKDDIVVRSGAHQDR